MATPVFDPKRKHARISRASTPGPKDAAVVQDGNMFNAQLKFIGKSEGFRRHQEQAAKQEEELAARKASNEAASRAAAILGDLGSDPNEEARRENAQAAAAEELSDDAPEKE